MKIRLFMITTLALGTTTLTTGCEKPNGGLLGTVASKAGELQRGLQERGINVPGEAGDWAMPGDGGFEMPRDGGFEMPSDAGFEMPSDGGGWAMPSDGGWAMPSDGGGWAMPSDGGGWAMPSDGGGFAMAEDPAAFQRRMAQQSQAFQAYNTQVQADSNRRFEAVQDWTKTVIRGE